MSSTRFSIGVRNLPVLGLALALGCASATHVPIRSDADDQEALGIRYYGTSPYLIVHSNEKGGLVAEIKYLPDPNKKMAVRPKAVMSKVTTKLTFDKGVMTKSDTDIDATAVPNAIVKAVETVAPALLAALDMQQEGRDRKFYTVPAPHIYKIIVQDGTVHFVGGKGDVDFNVTVLPQEKKATKKEGA